MNQEAEQQDSSVCRAGSIFICLFTTVFYVQVGKCCVAENCQAEKDTDNTGKESIPAAEHQKYACTHYNEQFIPYFSKPEPQWREKCAASKYKADIGNVAADDVTYHDVSVSFQGCCEADEQFRYGSPEGDNGQAYDKSRDPKTFCQA